MPIQASGKIPPNTQRAAPPNFLHIKFVVRAEAIAPCSTPPSPLATVMIMPPRPHLNVELPATLPSPSALAACFINISAIRIQVSVSDVIQWRQCSCTPRKISPFYDGRHCLTHCYQTRSKLVWATVSVTVSDSYLCHSSVFPLFSFSLFWPSSPSFSPKSVCLVVGCQLSTFALKSVP